MKDVHMTKEMLEKAKQVASAEELMSLARTHGIELEAQEAAKLFASLHNQTQGELGENDLSEVAGGWYDFEDPRKRKKKKGC